MARRLTWFMLPGDYVIMEDGEVHRVAGEPVMLNESGLMGGMTSIIETYFDALTAFEEKDARVLDYTDQDVSDVGLWGD